jgi:hypothetical protein
VAPDRGVPADASHTVQAEIEALGGWKGTAEAHSFTWLTWREIESIDWGEGPKRLGLTALPSAIAAPVPDQNLAQNAHASPTRRETLEDSPTWLLIFDLMRRLAADFGAERVRIVVWFDS